MQNACFHLFGVTKSQNVEKKQKVKCLVVSYSTFQHKNFLILGKIRDGDQDGGYLGWRHRHPAALQPITYIRLVEHITGFLLKVKSFPNIVTPQKPKGAVPRVRFVHCDWWISIHLVSVCNGPLFYFIFTLFLLSPPIFTVNILNFWEINLLLRMISSKSVQLIVMMMMMIMMMRIKRLVMVMMMAWCRISRRLWGIQYF